jgi:hypothetical protein
MADEVPALGLRCGWSLCKLEPRPRPPPFCGLVIQLTHGLTPCSVCVCCAGNPPLHENVLWGALTLLLLLLSWRVLSHAGGGPKATAVSFPVHMRQADGPKDEYDHAPFQYSRLPEDEMAARAIGFHELLRSRLSL